MRGSQEKPRRLGELPRCVPARADAAQVGPTPHHRRRRRCKKGPLQIHTHTK